MMRWASSSIRLANAVCVTISPLTSTTNLLQTTQHSRLHSKPATMYSKPPLQPAVDGPRKEHDQWRQELEQEQGRLREGIHELRGWLVDNFQNVIGCLRDDILDTGNNLFQSHTPHWCRYACTPSPHRLEVPASPSVETYSPPTSLPNLSSCKHAIPDKPQTSRGKRKQSNARDAVESKLNVIRWQVYWVLFILQLMEHATATTQASGVMNYPCDSSEGVW